MRADAAADLERERAEPPLEVVAAARLEHHLAREALADLEHAAEDELVAEALLERRDRHHLRDRAEADEAMKDMVRRQEEQAREKIAQAEAAAIQEVRSMSVELAMAAAEKLLAERLAGEEGSRLIDNSIEDIPRKLQ